VFDDTSGRRWWPNEHEQARMARMMQDRDHYPNCRHYKKTGDGTFTCAKYGNTKKTCSGCMTCPNCGGMMYTYRIKKEQNRDRIYITHSKSCIICGVYIEEHYVMAQVRGAKRIIETGHNNKTEYKRKESISGSKNNRAKLKEQDIPKIKQMLKEGICHREIAEKFGVSKGPISGISLGRNWTHVGDETNKNA